MLQNIVLIDVFTAFVLAQMHLSGNSSKMFLNGVVVEKRQTYFTIINECWKEFVAWLLSFIIQHELITKIFFLNPIRSMACMYHLNK